MCAALAACGSSSSSSQGSSATTAKSGTAGRAAATAPVTLHYRGLGTLPAPTQDAAGAPAPGGISVLAGGLSAADTSTDEVWRLNGARLVSSGHLPGPQHDAAAAAVGGSVYVFGGADFNQYDHILRIGPGTTVAAAGRLPSLASDVSAASSPTAAYVVGGYDGSRSSNAVIAYRPGSAAHVVAHLPLELRYASTAVAGGQLIVAGGSTPSGASRQIFAVNLNTGQVRSLGRLPRPLTHAAIGVIGSTVYVIGGRGDALGSPTAAILAIDPATGRLHSAGRLPRALSDLTAVSQPGAILVYGGRTSAATVSSVGSLSASG